MDLAARAPTLVRGERHARIRESLKTALYRPTEATLVPWITYAPKTCDWCRISSHLPGSQWHPTHCGRMNAEDLERLSDTARRIYGQLDLANDPGDDRP